MIAKVQAASCKLQAASCKLQAASCKLQALTGWRPGLTSQALFELWVGF
jgi:hypothetical protein